jgi:hypothetical protein
MFLLLPVLQALAAIFTIWGVCNAPSTNDAVVTYGFSGEDAVTWLELAKSYGAISVGGISTIVMWLYKRKNTGELMLAIIAYFSNKSDPTVLRRLGLAFADFLATDVVAFYKDNPEAQKWWQETAAAIRTQIVTVPMTSLTK